MRNAITCRRVEGPKTRGWMHSRFHCESGDSLSPIDYFEPFDIFRILINGRHGLALPARLSSSNDAPSCRVHTAALSFSLRAQRLWGLDDWGENMGHGCSCAKDTRLLCIAEN